MAITRGVRELVAEANAAVETIPTAKAIALHGDESILFVDIRDVRELDREGMVAGAFHAPRGMLEFWVDPASPYYREIFGDEAKTYLLYCQSGWRSALAAKALGDMGMTNVAHIEGGFKAWKETGGPTGERPKKQ